MFTLNIIGLHVLRQNLRYQCPHKKSNYLGPDFKILVHGSNLVV